MKLTLLDKDGTLVKPKSAAKFVNKPGDQEPLPGAKEAIAHYHRQGWKICIISNQGGVAAGHKTLESTILEMRFCLDLFPEIEEAYFCPDFQGMDCYCVWQNDSIYYNQDSYFTWQIKTRGEYRKPNSGMLKLASYIHAATECWMIGDRQEDEDAATNAGINFIPADIWRERFCQGLYKV